MYDEIIEPLDFLIKVFRDNQAEIDESLSEFIESRHDEEDYNALDKFREYLQDQIEEFISRLEETRDKFLENLENLNQQAFERDLTYTFQPLGVLKAEVNFKSFFSRIANMSSNPTRFKEIIQNSQYFF
jgi:hypothetical protein